jgi:hypothetical protein
MRDNINRLFPFYGACRAKVMGRLFRNEDFHDSLLTALHAGTKR